MTKQPKAQPFSHAGSPKTQGTPNFNVLKPVWKFKHFDWSHEKWGEKNVSWREVLTFLGDLESQTWQEIKSASGGKKAGRGTNHHAIAVSDLAPEAQKRLRELKLDDLEALFSLRKTGKSRVWGVLKGHELSLLWVDQHHEVCPSAR